MLAVLPWCLAIISSPEISPLRDTLSSLDSPGTPLVVPTFNTFRVSLPFPQISKFQETSRRSLGDILGHNLQYNLRKVSGNLGTSEDL